MALSKDQIASLKKQLLEQVKNLPRGQREEAENQIKNLPDSAIEEMLESQKESSTKIFREIVSGKLLSKKVEENEYSVAVLEIKPISKGHTIIIPKNIVESIDKIPKNVKEFSENIAKKLSDKLKVKHIKSIPEKKFGETIINLIPIYEKDVSLESERLSPSEEDLNNILETIKKEVKEIKPEKQEVKEEVKLVKLKRRIP